LLLGDLEPNVFNDLDKIAVENNWLFKCFMYSYSHFDGYSIVLVDLKLNICAASSNMEEMTGYKREEVIGQTPSFLQGEETNLDSKFLLKIAIDQEVPFHSRLVNYDRDGDLYGCEIHTFPIYNGSGKLSHYIALEQLYCV
jgi:PAS domain S-box-containing protein